MNSDLSRVFNRRILLFAVVLAFVAGFVNSVAFVEWGSFVSHISGHATRTAIEFSESHIVIAIQFMLAAFCFVAGATCATVAMRGRFISQIKVSALMPFLIEAGLLIGIVGLWYSKNTHGFDGLTGEQGNQVYVCLLSIAMGWQNAMLRGAAGGIIRTTHMTGVATDLGISFGLIILRVFQKLFGRFMGQTWTHLHVAHPGPLLIHLTLFVSFFAGAILGTYGVLHYSPLILLLPSAMLIVAGCLDQFVLRYSPAFLHAFDAAAYSSHSATPHQ